MSPKKKFCSALLRINGKVVKHAWVNTEPCSDESSDDYSDVSSDDYSDVSSDDYSDVSSDDYSDESADEDEWDITHEIEEFGKKVFKAAAEWKIRRVELMKQFYKNFDALSKLAKKIEEKEDEFAELSGVDFSVFYQVVQNYCQKQDEVLLCAEMLALQAKETMELEAYEGKSEEEEKSDDEEVKSDLEEAKSEEDDTKSDAGDKKCEEEETESKKKDEDPKAEDLESEEKDEQPKKQEIKLEPEDTEPPAKQQRSKTAVRKSKADAPKPKTEAPKPKIDAPKPKTEATKPKTEAGKPKTDASKPKSEASKPKTEAGKPKTDAPKPKTEAPKPKPDAPKPKTETPKPKTKMNKKSTIKSKLNRKKRKSNIKDQDPSILVSIGPNKTKVPECVLNNIDWSQPTAATRKLLMTIFDRETLAFHTLTGKPSPAFLECNRPTKDQLNPKKVADIIHIVTKRSKVHEKDVRGAITTKCADENKMFKQREKRKLSLDENKENSLPKSNPRRASKSKNNK